MALRITRRTFVGWLVRSASAAAATGLLASGPATTHAVNLVTPHPQPLSLRGRGGQMADVSPSPAHRERGSGGEGISLGLGGEVAPVRMADLTVEGRDFRNGLADGVRLPSQGGDAWALTPERPGGTYTTSALQAAFPVSHVGVHWRTDGGDQHGLRVELRGSLDGQRWMPWRPIHLDMHGPDRPSSASLASETFGALVGGRLATWLQARVTFQQAGPEVAAVQALTLTCLDARRPAVTGAINRAPTRPAAVGARFIAPNAIPLPGRDSLLMAGPSSFLDRVVSREVWGADESLRFKDGVDQWLAAFVTPSLLVVHHTAGDNDTPDPEADVRAIYAFHAVTRGWGDIGYNLLIDSSGQVYEGRRGREPDASGKREIVSEGVVAGHALDYNYGSVGIALLGNYQERPPGQAMLDTLVDALAFMARRYGIDPTSTQNYVRARGDTTAFWRDQMQTVSGHRDCLPTECPGDNVYARLPELRRRVEERLGQRGPSVRMTVGPAERNLWPGALLFQWEGADGPVEVSTRLAAWRRIPGKDTIETLSGYTDDERPAWEPWTRGNSLLTRLPPDAKGVYTLMIRARDADGIEGRVVARWPLVIDRQVVVDDTDAMRTRHEGVWERSREVLGYYGIGYQQAAPGQDGAQFRWQLSVPEDGRYAVQASWTEGEYRSAAATYTITQGGKSLGETTVNQQQPGGKWAPLLETPLAAGVACVVELAGAADGVVVADAIRVVRLD